MTNQELKQKIEYHNMLYYQENKPEITDAEYDELKRKAIKTGEEVQVGAEPDGRFSKVTHLSPMLSLDNSYTEQDLGRFLTRVKKLLNTDKLEIICEPKIDGLSFSAVYEDGVFMRASTRGNGYCGEDVTRNVMTIAGFPKTLPGIKGRLEIRGEIYIANDDFLRLNKNNDFVILETQRLVHYDSWILMLLPEDRLSTLPILCYVEQKKPNMRY